MKPTPGDPNPLRHAPPLEVRRAQEARLLKAWATPKGWRYWSEVNNTHVGIWYTAAVFLFLLFGGVLALLIRIQLAVPDNDFLSAETYNQVFTVHGSVMMFLVAIPLFEAISILFLPPFLGTRELPFPRLSAFGLWAFLIGGVFLSGSILFGAAPNGGWFMYPPLTSRYEPGIGADMWLLGFSFIEVAAIAASVELIIGVLKSRPVGMRINLIPLYGWYVLVAAAMVLFAFPSLIAGSLLLELERAFDWPFFDPTRGGDPLLWQHLFWLFGHPEVYVIFLPSVALVAMMVPTFARTPIVGYEWIVLSAIGTGFLSFGLWVHHMFTTGLPGISLALFSAASMAVAIPTGVQIFCFLGTLLVGRVVRSVPLLFVFGGLATFVIGGLTGVMVAMATFDFQAHDTFFVVAHLHTVLIGGTVFPFLAACYYYFPLATGYALSNRLGRICFWLVFVGFQVTFMPMHISGLLGMPRRVFTYPSDPNLNLLNLTSTVGAFVLAAGFAVFLWDVLRPKRKQGHSPRNPWGSGTLEWLPRLPAKPWGLRSIPEIDSRYPIWEQKNFERDVDEGRFFLPDAEELKREMLVSSVIDARPEQCLRVSGPSYVPLVAAIFTGGIFIFPTFKLWTWMAVSTVLALGTILYWLWTATAVIPEKDEKYIGHGVRVPLYRSGPASVGWWAMLITMLADITAFAAVVFGYFFYWTLRPEFPPGNISGPGTFWPAAALALLLAAWGLTFAARRWNARDQRSLFYLAIAGGVVLALAGAAALLAGPWTHQMVPSQHVYSATVWVLVAWTALHVVLGVVMQLYCGARRWAGRMSAKHDIDIWNTTLYWHFVALMTVVTVVVIAVFPRLR
ncbi:MAG TPA: cbb3-type cytochrome c oxidase subunit I, partial [Gemmatimonadaceae bacterium]